MNEIRKMALKSYVNELLKKSMNIQHLKVVSLLINFARKSSTIEEFNEKILSKGNIKLPVDLSLKVFSIVKQHDSVVFEDEFEVDAELPLISKNQPKNGLIYRGKVISISSNGAYIRLDGFSKLQLYFLPLDEMKPMSSHISASDILTLQQRIFVKVLDDIDGKIILSIKGVDQNTGMMSYDRYFNKDNELGSLINDPRLPSPEKFVIDKILHSGANQEELASMVGTSFSRYNPETDEFFDIALNKTIPKFLESFKTAKRTYNPQKIQSNPEGSLARTAREAIKLSKERQEIRRNNQTINVNVSDIVGEEPRLRTDLTKVELDELPEWKRESFTSFGPRFNKDRLPIEAYKEQIKEVLINNKVFVLIGETGSGKTTQLPQYIYEWGITDKMIVITQPRRVAAISVSTRVAQEMNTSVGDLVGYQVRFEDKSSRNTRIKFMTDGMLLKECLNNKDLSNIGVIILDEAHERTISTDVLFGIMHQLLTGQTHVKVIVTSATLQQSKFSEFFFNCPVLEIPGRTFDVTVSYAYKAFDDYLEASVNTVISIHRTEPKPGDILLFLTGQEDIDTACEKLYFRAKDLEKEFGKLIILPIYSSLPQEQQSMIFEPTPHNQRKVVVATNIAETSITIDGIVFVVDPGLVKEMRYDPNTGMETLEIVPISKAAANQRKGRAGRTAPGKCFRLYTENSYNKEIAETSTPEIQRANIANVALDMKVLGIDDLINFEFMDKPPQHIIIDALEQLYVLSALDEDGKLTLMGKKMAQFSLDPQLSKMLIHSSELGCSEEILSIVSLLSVPSIWYRPRKQQVQADEAKIRLNQPDGDHLTLLHVYSLWKKSGESEEWCKKHFVHNRSLLRASDIRNQIHEQMIKANLKLSSCGDYTRNTEPILRSIVSGFFSKASKRSTLSEYRTLVDDHLVYLFPGSALFGHEPEYIIYHEIVNTTKEYMRNTVRVDPRWLIELAPSFYRRASLNEMTTRRQHERLGAMRYKKTTSNQDWRVTNQRVKGF